MSIDIANNVVLEDVPLKLRSHHRISYTYPFDGINGSVSLSYIPLAD